MQKLEPQFYNSWSYYQDKKDFHVYLDSPMPSFVWITGLVAFGTLSQSLPAFYLPEWAWPDKEYRLACWTFSGPGRLSIHPDGRVCPTSGSNQWFELAGIWRKALTRR